jgi:hypothetical protein
MADINSGTSMVGNFREVYGSNFVDLIPGTNKLTKAVNFEHAQALGAKYHQPVELAQEHGVTYAAAGASSITLLDPVAGESQDAQVEGSQVFARSRVDYESMFKASQAGAKAFAKATALVVKRLTKAAGKRLEIMTLHGRRGLGVMSAISGTSTTRVLTISDASWAAGIWAGAKGATLDVWNSALSAKQNTNAKMVVTAVSLSAKQISVSGNASDLTALDALAAASPVLFYETGSPTNDFAGLDAITQNAGSLFGISAATYELWKGHVVSSVGRPSMQAILDGVRRAAELGCEDDMTAIASPKAFEVLNDDVAALRKYDSSYSVKEGQNGVESITYHGQTGTTTVMPHMYQKDGQINIAPLSQVKRIGATDLTFITRGADGSEKLILELANSPGAEMRMYFNGALFVPAPAHTVVLTGLSYT